MESMLSIRIVGNYGFKQGDPEDCIICHNADWGDVIIEGICGKCLHHHRDSTLGLWATDQVMNDTIHFHKDSGNTLDELSMMAYAEGWIKEATPQCLLDAIEQKKRRIDVEEADILYELEQETWERRWLI